VIPLGLVMAATTTIAAADLLEPIGVKTDPRINEFNATATGEWLAWTQNSIKRPGRYNVYAKNGSDPRVKVNAKGTQAATGDIDRGRLVYSQWPSARGEQIYRLNLSTMRRTLFPRQVNSRYDEFHPSLSGRWLLFTRGTYPEGSKVMLYNTRTGKVRTLAQASGQRSVWAGQVNGAYAVWARWTATSADVFRFHLGTQTTTRIPRPEFAYQNDPSVASDGTVYYSRSGEGCGTAAELAKYPVGGPAEVVYGYPTYAEGGYSHIEEPADGSRHIYFNRIDCRRADHKNSDIYRVVDPAPAP
jgi:hypothetical protein